MRGRIEGSETRIYRVDHSMKFHERRTCTYPQKWVLLQDDIVQAAANEKAVESKDKEL